MRRSPDPPGQLAAFRARFHCRRRPFVQIRVFRSAAALRAYARRSRPVDAFAARRFHALATIWSRSRLTPSGRWRRTPEHGEILLCRPHLSPEVIAHEAAHHALGYARRRRLVLVPRRPLANESATSLADADEEHFCYALGGLTAAITHGLRVRGLLPRV